MKESKQINDVTNSSLSPLEEQILRLRKGEEGKSLSLEEVSKALGITREKVRQIEARALRKIESINAGQESFELNIGSSDGEEFALQIHPGDHILVNGDAGTGKTILFKKMISELYAQYADRVDSIVVFDSKGCEYRSRNHPMKTVVFQGDKTRLDFEKFIEDSAKSPECLTPKRIVFLFVDEGYLLAYHKSTRLALERLAEAKKNFVVVLSSQVGSTLKPFLKFANIFVQFRPRVDQPKEIFPGIDPVGARSFDAGTCIILTPQISKTVSIEPNKGMNSIEEIKVAKEEYMQRKTVSNLLKIWPSLTDGEKDEYALAFLLEQGQRLSYALDKMPELSKYLNGMVYAASATPSHLQQLGRIFQYGKKFARPNAKYNVKANKKKALVCYLRAIEEADAGVWNDDERRVIEEEKSVCIASAGLTYAELGDGARALEWLGKGLQYDSAYGYFNSANALGRIYRYGIGVEKSLPKAVEHYEKGGDAGLHHLGEMHLYGEFGEPDYEKAFDCFNGINDYGWLDYAFLGYCPWKLGAIDVAFTNFAWGLEERAHGYLYGEEEMNESYFDPCALGIGILYATGFTIDNPSIADEKVRQIFQYALASLSEAGVYDGNRIVIKKQPKKAYRIFKNSQRLLKRQKNDEYATFWLKVIAEEGAKLPKPYCDWIKDGGTQNC